EVTVCVNAAVAQEGPVAADFFDAGRVARRDGHFFTVVAGAVENGTEGVAEEGRAPELQAAVHGPFMANAVDGRHIDPVGDGMGALDQLPGLVLGGAELSFLARVPADRCRIE